MELKLRMMRIALMMIALEDDQVKSISEEKIVRNTAKRRIGNIDEESIVKVALMIIVAILILIEDIRERKVISTRTRAKRKTMTTTG